jgi:Holliday junction resolvase
MSKKSIGDYYERRAKKELEQKGFIVFKPVRTKYSTQKDIFNLFDLIAWNPNKGCLYLLQVKKNKNEYTKKELKKFRNFANNLLMLFIGLSYFEKGKMELLESYGFELKSVLIDSKNLVPNYPKKDKIYQK